MTAPFDPSDYQPPRLKWCACRHAEVEETDCDGEEVRGMISCSRPFEYEDEG